MTDDQPAVPDAVEPAPAVPPAEPDPTAREAVEAALRPILPKRWQLVWNEGQLDDTGRTRLRLTQQSVERHTAAGASAVHLVTFAATLTVPTDDYGTAEAQLDDDLESLLWAIDGLGMVWTKADKGLFGKRLGYSFNLSVSSFRKAP